MKLAQYMQNQIWNISFTTSSFRIRQAATGLAQPLRLTSPRACQQFTRHRAAQTFGFVLKYYSSPPFKQQALYLIKY